MQSSTILPPIGRNPTGLWGLQTLSRLIALVLLPFLLGLPGSVARAAAAPTVLRDTAPLAQGHGGVGNWNGVIDAEIDRATKARPQHWHRDFSSVHNYNRSIETNRARFAHIIGVRDETFKFLHRHLGR